MDVGHIAGMFVLAILAGCCFGAGLVLLREALKGK